MIRYSLACNKGHTFESWLPTPPLTTSRPSADW